MSSVTPVLNQPPEVASTVITSTDPAALASPQVSNYCQILHGMECGMCGYEGRGVHIDQVDTVAEHCCHCNARTYQSPEGICELCGKDAETPDTPALPPASCFWDCGPVSTDAQCRLCRDLERHARGGALQDGHEDRTAPTPAAPGHGIVGGGR